MRRTLLIAFVLGALSGVLLPAFGTAAQHWPLGSYSGDDTFNIDGLRTPPFTNTDFYFRGKEAAATWSAVAGSGFDFIYSDPQPSLAHTLDANIVPDDHTYLADYWSPTCVLEWCWNFPSTGNCPQGYTCQLGYTAGKALNGVVYKALSVINEDDDINWYTGNGSVAITQWELRSIITHELGHAAGAGHINSECSGSGMATMCGYASSFKGNSYGRTLNTHDQADKAERY